MNLYYFNPNGYGEEAFVCAESKEKAIEYLKTSERYRGSGEETPEMEKRNIEYHERKIKEMTSGVDGYTVEEYPPGEVVFSEIC